MAKKKRRPERKPARTLPQPLVEGLQEAERLCRRKQWVQARDLIETLDRRYPQRREVLAALVTVAYSLGDWRSLQATCERLVQLAPATADLLLMLAEAYLNNVRPALALQTFQQFLERWPDHPEAARVRETVSGLETKIQPLLAEVGLSGEDALQLGAWHEQASSLVEQGKFTQARQVAGRLLQRWPDFVPALNNTSEAFIQEGRTEEAIGTAQRVLSIAPENYHGLSNLIRFLFFSGRAQEARVHAERLKALASTNSEIWVKKADALSVLGDDQGVLEAWRGAEQAGLPGYSASAAMLAHLAAVAAYRLGQHEEAQRLWKQALRHLPGYELAQANLDDLRKPVDQRHAPWPFNLPYWISLKTVEDLATHLKSAKRRSNDDAERQAMRRYLQTHPQVAHLIPALLDRGDPAGREFGLRLASLARTPDLLAALQEFIGGQRGPDAMRVEAAEVLSQAGLVPAGPVRMWLQGDWREILILGFELHGEPSHAHSGQVADWSREAHAALYQGDGARAERLLHKALEVKPDAPDLLNNLALSYQLQGRIKEGEQLAREILQGHPDYLFARTAVAQLYVRDGEPLKAKALLEPLLSRRRMHFSEFGALCMAQMDVLLALGEREGARRWLEMWEGVDPDNPRLPEWRQRLRKSKLWGWLSGGRS